MQLAQRRLLRGQVGGNGVRHRGFRDVGGRDADRTDQLRVQVVQHMPLVAIDPLAAALAPMAHLRVFEQMRRSGATPARSAARRRGRARHPGPAPGARRPGSPARRAPRPLGAPPALLHRVQGREQRRERLRPRGGVVPVQIERRFQAGASDQRRPGVRRHLRQPPPLLAREHAQRLPQGVAQQVIGVFDPPGAPQRARIQGAAQLARAEPARVARPPRGCARAGGGPDRGRSAPAESARGCLC